MAAYQPIEEVFSILSVTQPEESKSALSQLRAPLENLQFLTEFPRLTDFRFVDKNVLDGDLSPLFDHPTLLSVGFLNKKHYNRTEKQPDEYFGERVESKQEWVHDGQFATHRYKIFSHINSLK